MTSLKTDGMAIIVFFIGAVVAITFLASIADEAFSQTNTIIIRNVTVTASAVNVTLDVTGRDLLTVIAIYNATNETRQSYVGNGSILQSGISSTTGLRTIQFVVNDSEAGPSIVGTTVNISYTANPDGYLSDSGSRSIMLLTVIFGSLAILIFGIVEFMSKGSMGKLIGRG